MSNISIPKIRANDLLKELGITEASDLSDLEGICHSQGIDLQYGNLGTSEGRIVFGKDNTTIIVKENEKYPQRERFTIAHELGHFLLHKELLRDKACSVRDMYAWSGKKQDIESEANEFAGEFLIPSQFLKPIVEDETVSYEMANKISKQFGSSLTSSILRHLEITKFATAVVFYTPQKALYYRRSKPMEDMYLFPIYPEISKYSAASKCSTYIEEPKANVVFSECWFDKDLDKYTVHEQANFFPSINLGISIITLKLKK